MPSFSKTSADRLATCHPDLQLLLTIAIRDADFSVLCGHRSDEEQEAAYASGASKARAGQSAHNSLPSRAVDIAPYPIDWEDRERFYRLIGRIEQIADQLGVEITWGGDFESLSDLPHIELKGA